MAKAFAWSYSRLKNYETCPKRYYEIDVQKTFKDEGAGMEWGNRVHQALHKRVGFGVPLPVEMQAYEPWASRIERGMGGELMVEQKFAITKDFCKTGYFDGNVWFRGIGDVIRVAPPVALVADYKTGKILEDSVQLALMAQCVFVHYPDVQRIRSEFIWLKDDCTTHEVFNRDDMAALWRLLYDRVNTMEAAAQTLTYPPKPGRLCKRYCPVTSCPFHGKGTY